MATQGELEHLATRDVQSCMVMLLSRTTINQIVSPRHAMLHNPMLLTSNSMVSVTHLKQFMANTFVPSTMSEPSTFNYWLQSPE